MMRGSGPRAVLRFGRTWLALVLALTSLHAESPLEIEGKGGEFQGRLIGRHLEFLADEAGTLDLAGARAAAANGAFQSVNADSFQPRTRAVWWLRLPLRNETTGARSFILELDNHFIDRVRLYLPEAAGEQERVQVTGDMLPFAQRSVAFRNFAFRVNAPPGDSEIYLRLATRGAQRFGLRIFSPGAFQVYRRADTLSNGLFLGGLAMIGLYNLFLFMAVRDAGYLYVAGIVFVCGINFTWAIGVGFQFLWPHAPVLNDHLIVSIPLSFLVLVPYLRRVLETDARAPRVDRSLVAFFILALIFILVYPFVPYSFYARTGVAFLLPAATIFLAVLSLTGIFVLGTAYPAGRYFLTGVFLLGLSLALTFYVLALGVPNSFATQIVAKVAFSLFSAFLSMSVLFKIRHVRDNLQRLNAGREATTAEALEPADSGGDSTGWSITPRMERKLQMALNLLRENYREEISREGLAAELNLNPDNLGRLFKMYTGDKIGDYVNKLRVQAAAWRLRDPERKIAEVAVEVGFENLSTFNRVFKNIMKTTPSRFRDMASG